MQADGEKAMRVGHDGTLERLEIERRETRQQFPKCHDILRVPTGISKESLVEPCRDPLGTSRIRQLDNSTTRHSLKSSCRNVELSKCRAVGSTTCRVGMEFKPRRTTSCCVCRGTPALHEEVGRCVGETLLLTWTSLESPSSKATTESSESCVAVWYESPVRRWTDGVLGALICTNKYKRHVCPGSCTESTVYKQGKLKYIRAFSCSNASPI